MLFDDDLKIELFVKNLNHPAAIRFCNGEHALTNDKWNKFVGNVENASLKDLHKNANNELLKTNIRYCMQCDEEALVALEPLVHFESFNNSKYVTNRIAISYKSKKALIIIAVELD